MPDGTRRVVIEAVRPQVDGGRFAVKRVVGEAVEVHADVFADGHDELGAVVRHRTELETVWTEVPMEPLGNDAWRATFAAGGPGRHLFHVEGWVDELATWRTRTAKKVAAAQDVEVELVSGALLVDAAAERARAAKAKADAEALKEVAAVLRSGDTAPVTSDDAELIGLLARHPDRTRSTSSDPVTIAVDAERARFSAWYELFPRSWSPVPGAHGTLRDVRDRLPYLAELGFDVLYLPPIHPIGTSFRKGRNNALVAEPDDVGSPWAIGSPEGGHTAVHPQLGTVDDVRDLVGAARALGIEVALDFAIQCSPDHPWVTEHPEWFRMRPDGTIQYAENPPKKYQDIYPLDFDSVDWQGLWAALLGVVTFWIDQGVRTFRVDNPHTKSFAFWEWLIGEVKWENPDVVFLSEAFTRPKVMHRLAKLGFTQSYTYFAWRTAKWELTEYFTELTRGPGVEYLRPSVWPNTPDILTEQLQHGGRAAFVTRFVLAATLSASYGIYGPAFELGEHVPREPGSEEYLDSEKYQIRVWDLDRPDSLRDLVARVNRIRRTHPALQSDRSLRFHHVDNDQLLCYSKRTADFADVVLCVVNLDPHWQQAGWVHLDLEELGVAHDGLVEVRDLLTGAQYLWSGPANYVELDPAVQSVHVFEVRAVTPLDRPPA
ncbi:MAG: alpha-1,4-glucan--maltose-1-phosphate maltosyltransferase [Acidimicrobiales bacterium]|nr:alpha-1,4-glucan--maltose-1-phosphate maltosyltransferase [Acidimicrobiales bacterium]